jgi:hypothetical protein
MWRDELSEQSVLECKISGEELQRVSIIMFDKYTKCIWSGGQHFSMSSSTGESLLEFLKVILTAIAYHQDLHYLGEGS